MNIIINDYWALVVTGEMFAQKHSRNFKQLLRQYDRDGRIYSPRTTFFALGAHFNTYK